MSPARVPPATRLHHPASASPRQRDPAPRATDVGIVIPGNAKDAEVAVGERRVRLTNLPKVFWPALGITKRDLLQYYVDVSPWLLPHVEDRAMVMKRYPNGAAGEFFFMKRTPSPRPEWLETCSIAHGSGNIIDFPMVQDLASLLWVVNLGCIDLNQWYARCDDVDRPDYLHFDLDPVPGATFETVRETAFVVRDALQALGMQPLLKTTGSRGLHIYIPIVRGPLQKTVWTFAKSFAQAVALQRPDIVTAEYKVAKRPEGRVLVDYNQNAWGRTLASIYSPRPKERATVSTPITWDELEHGAVIEDYDMRNVPQRVRRQGDLWAPLLEPKDRFDLDTLMIAPAPKRTRRKSA